MRTRMALITVLTWGMAACTGMAPSRLDYAPPADPPTTPGAGYVGSPSADLIWGQLLDRLNQSGLQVDLADPERGVMVATYSGDAAPYVTCGWILVHGGGDPEQVDASSEASFQRRVQGRSIEIGRDLNLDARLAVEVRPRGREALVEATANYVLTKTVVAADRSGRQRGRAFEIVSFSTGERGAFRKGTVCQPNGALERTVLDIVPPATRVARPAEPTGTVATRRSRIVQTEIASNDVFQQSSVNDGSGQQVPVSDDLEEHSAVSDDLEQPVLPSDDGEQTAATSDDVEQQASPSDDLEQPVLPSDDGEQTVATSDDLEQQVSPSDDLPEQPSAGEDLARAPLECAIADKTFCAVLEATDSYRRANEERGLGLELRQIEAGNPLVAGSDLGLDISLPNYDAYLAVSYFLRDGTVHHILSGRNWRWPANAREFLGDLGLGTDQSGNVELVVALASDVPLFASPRPRAEAAETYLADLRRRLAEMSGASDPAQIAASLLVITPAPQQPT